MLLSLPCMFLTATKAVPSPLCPYLFSMGTICSGRHTSFVTGEQGKPITLVSYVYGDTHAIYGSVTKCCFLSQSYHFPFVPNVFYLILGFSEW